MYASSWWPSTGLDSFTGAAYRGGTSHLVAHIKRNPRVNLLHPVWSKYSKPWRALNLR